MNAKDINKGKQILKKIFKETTSKASIINTGDWIHDCVSVNTDTITSDQINYLSEEIILLNSSQKKFQIKRSGAGLKITIY